MTKAVIPRPCGPWTSTKLEHLSAYLRAFAKATQRARGRHYIDAMAGCGELVIKRSGMRIRGSAWLPLETDPPFTTVHLVEQQAIYAQHLRDTLHTYPNVYVYEGDCNLVIPNQVLPNLSRVDPTLAFIDPTGIQPNFSLMEALASHRHGYRGEKIELLILFAFDMFINRWMNNPRDWARLDAFFGSTEWHRVARESEDANEVIEVRRQRFAQYYAALLRQKLGYKYAEPLGLLRRRNKPLYQMVFATDHEVGLRIMRSVWSSFRPPADDMFYQRRPDIEQRG